MKTLKLTFRHFQVFHAALWTLDNRLIHLIHGGGGGCCTDDQSVPSTSAFDGVSALSLCLDLHINEFLHIYLNAVKIHSCCHKLYDGVFIDKNEWEIPIYAVHFNESHILHPSISLFMSPYLAIAYNATINMGWYIFKKCLTWFKYCGLQSCL